MKKVSIIILNYNTAAMTHKAVASLTAVEMPFDCELIIVDNGSKESLPPFTDPRVRVLRSECNLGFAGGVNFALAAAKGEYVLLLNSDMIMLPEALKSLVDYMDADTRIGICGPQLRYPNGAFQPSCGRWPTVFGELLRVTRLSRFIPGGMLMYPRFAVADFFTKPRIVDWVSGGCMLIRRRALEQCGVLDERFFFGVEDLDICRRFSDAGWKVAYHPLATVIHYHGFSSGGPRATLKHEARGMQYFLAKHFPRRKLLRLAAVCSYGLRIALIETLSFLKCR